MPACKMLHARYVGSDKRLLGGTWQRIKPPSRFATVVPTVCDNRKARFVNMWDMSHIFVFSCFRHTRLDVIYKQGIILHTPSGLFLGTVPVSKFAAGTATTCADTASAASGKG